MKDLERALGRSGGIAVKQRAGRAAAGMALRAHDAGLLDVGYGYTDTPFGRMRRVTRPGLVASHSNRRRRTTCSRSSPNAFRRACSRRR